ncbi:MAG: hypothetical protein CSA76_03130 [Spirochaetales bacterium]|nr:MAG: hypothetical protein CSA76_03130 [Spirochaetales bacterium]
MKPLIRILLGLVLGIMLTLGGVILFGQFTPQKKPAAPSLPDSMGAVITHIAGPVFIIRGEESLEVIPGDRVQPGDVIKVTEGAMAQVQLADKGSALLGSDTLVRFIKLTGADRKLELRTEILTGSLSYKVEKLDNSESIIIHADNTEYEITGTEFVLEKRSDGSILIVGEGTVRASGTTIQNGKVLVKAEQQLLVRGTSDPLTPQTGSVMPALPAAPESASKENLKRLQEAAPLPAMPFGFSNAPKPVPVEINTTPPDAQIYIDGLKTGTGKFSGILPQGTVIDLRVRRRGFLDFSTKLTAESPIMLDVVLKPAGIKDTLNQPAGETPAADQLKADYERRIAELKESFAGKAAADKEMRARLEMEKTRADVLETELADSKAENQKLIDLIRQIQELADKEKSK